MHIESLKNEELSAEDLELKQLQQPRPKQETNLDALFRKYNI